ncbi:RHS repeat-associated core domain-containing protein [Kribbella sandramycini]|uniref:RHS repeat-associated core domain-containing protein n=1 Tax=Kribbella sandramycini TaxID=60450 RepID=A0A7Y4KVG7_9ACTN|nr:RHS repeat-associated core domain-containing protein [Kribbella sandramycini]MBB6567940.1 RHS repeat-associated protein [Kribbella sandramycini]NOL39465.1 RHS repeat-associated core domain-containing protein [Kribbella sandramycini]
MNRSVLRWRRHASAAVAGLVALSLAVPAQAVQLPEQTKKPSAPDVQSTPTVKTKDFVPTPPPVAPARPEPAARTAWPTGKQVPIRVLSPGNAKVSMGPRAKDKLTFQIDGKRAGGTVRVVVDYAAFKDSFGGDWASRLQIAGGQNQHNDTKTSKLSADVPVGTALTVAAAPAGSAGTYKATSLSPTGAWQVSTASGTFSWNYDFSVPQVPGGLVPELAASYSSQSVDGRTVATNNQTSWIGEGWDLGAGFIERSYKSCAEDLDGNNGKTKTGDLCWETENAVMSMGPKSGRLLFQNGTWRPENDDGTKVERIVRTAGVNGDDNGEYWKVTTPSGTQYYYGLNQLPGWSSGKAVTNSTFTVPVFGNDAGEPCHKATFATSVCQQAYRWSLDYVVDRNGNAMSYYYNVETGKYGQNLGASVATYTRSGTLRQLEYGLRDGNAYAQAPARVVFTTADRCAPGTNCTVHDAKSWPDVPWDAECAQADCKDELSPSFWSTKRLAKVNTQVSTGGGNYAHVNQWDLTHTYPAPGDASAAPLWLSSIARTGLATETPIHLPPMTFGYEMKPNRVDSAPDGLPALNRPRIITVTNESGGRTNVKYAAANCTPTTLPTPNGNGKRCFPVRWVMAPEVEPRNDWFHKYVVEEITEDDLVTTNYNGRTSYSYEGNAAWAYDENPLADPKYRSWTEWRGYEKVLVTKGDLTQEPTSPQSATRHQFYRGMGGNLTDSTGTVVPDSKQYAGMLREELTYNGVGGAVVSSEIHDPWSRRTAEQAPYEAFQIEEGRTQSRTALAAGGFRTTEVQSKYDEYGNVTEANDLGDTATAADDRCTTTTYIGDLPARSRTVAAACGVSSTDVIADTNTSYDSRGNATKEEAAKAFSGGTPAYQTQSTTTYDSYGRTLEDKDALGRATTTAYTDVNGLNTVVTTTNPLGHVSKQTLEPRVGQPVTEVDANNRVTSTTYDALGRLTAVWKPGRTKADQESPHLQFEYGVRQSGGPTWVKTLTLKANGNQVASYRLLDGFLRPRQTQEPSPLGGRILTDEVINSRGLVFYKRAPFYDNTTAPGTTLATAANGEVPSATVTGYDGAERPTAEVHVEFNVEKWRTTTTYGGDRVTVLPPAGGTLTTAVTDARGQTTARLQYQGRTTSTPADTTTYGYNKRGDLTAVTDAAGNAWRYEYDVLGRKTKVDDPDKGVATMTYDEAGQVLSTTDARGKTVATKYDALGRSVETHSGTTLLTKSVYDTLAKGQLTSSTRYVGANEYVRAVTGYDEAGRALGERVVIPESEDRLAGTYTTSQTYSDDGSLWSTGLPKLGDLAAETLNYSYTAFGQRDKLTGALPYVNNTKYTALGQVAQQVLGTTAKTLWRTTFYDAGTSRLSQVKTQRDAQGSVLASDQSYSYDPIGNVTKVADQVQGRALDTQCFSYDHLRRTTAAWTATDDCAAAPNAARIGGPAPYWQEYSYDATGNRTKLISKGLNGAADKVSTYAYGQPGSDRPHAVQSVTAGSTVASYQYDAAGNTVSRTGPDGRPQPLVWSDEGLLASVGGSTYLYDAAGQPLIRRDSGSSTLFVGAGELKQTGTVLKGTRYYDDLGVRTSGGFNWTVEDRYGTAQTALDAATLSITTRLLDPFGVPRGSASGWTGGDRAFVGGVPNAETGLTRLGAREYDPVLGKFLSVDPVIDPADPQQLNAYAYGNNSPATFTDPNGLRHIVDLDGYVTAPPAAGQSKSAMRKVQQRVNRYKKMYNKWGQAQRKKREAQRAKFQQRMRDRKNRGPLRMHKHVKGPFQTAAESVFGGDGFINSGSLCIEGFAGAGVGGGGEGCFNVDDKGFTFSAGMKAGVVYGADASISGVLKANTGDATTVNDGIGYEASGAPHLNGSWAKVMAHLGSTNVKAGWGGGLDMTHDPTTGNSSFAVKGGFGLGASMGGYYNTVGVNSGYVSTWETMDAVLGSVMGW